MSAKIRFTVGASAVALVAAAGLSMHAQEQYDRPTLLLPATMAAIANEVSGAQAFQNVVDIAGYEHDRRPSEYGAGTVREADVVASLAREAGLSEVAILKPRGEMRPQWDGEEGEVWIEEPAGSRRLLTRYRDVPATLAANSLSTDVTADLVFVGRGDREADYAGKDVKGKIVFGWGGLGAIHRMAVTRFGAVGALSYGVASGKPIDRPDEIVWGGIGAFPADGESKGLSRKAWFGFNLSHRMGMQLIDMTDRGPSRLSVKVRAGEYPLLLPLVTGTIPGDGSIAPPAKDEVVFVAHLFEGATKQGANDNTSGVAVQIEIARAWIKLVKDGRPAQAEEDDQVPLGARRSPGRRPTCGSTPKRPTECWRPSTWTWSAPIRRCTGTGQPERTRPSACRASSNDIAAQMVEWVGDTNREKVHNRRIAYAFQNPMIDPKGSQDPYRFAVDKFYGATDNQPFVDYSPRIPCVSFDNWPDIAYHTSDDTPRGARSDPDETDGVHRPGDSRT